MLHLRPSDYRVMPWKDGGGSTTEIAIDPPGSTLAEPFAWRVSCARVEASGPFSRFPGYTRSLALLEGAGMILDLEGKGRHRLKSPREPWVFSGDEAVHATLIQGPCLDFGVISDPTRIKASLEVLSLGLDATSITLAPTTLLFVAKGGVKVDPLGTELQAQETLIFGGPGAGGDGSPKAGAKLGLRAPGGDASALLVSLWPIG